MYTRTHVSLYTFPAKSKQILNSCRSIRHLTRDFIKRDGLRRGKVNPTSAGFHISRATRETRAAPCTEEEEQGEQKGERKREREKVGRASRARRLRFHLGNGGRERVRERRRGTAKSQRDGVVAYASSRLALC